MTIKMLLLIGTLLPYFAFSQSFYDRSVVQTIEIFFPSSSWDSQLDALASSTEGYLLADSVRINGITYDSVGVKYKGNSSYNASNNKNPLHIKLDYIDNQDHQGYTDIKLQNGYQDPSMIREVLSYAILEQFMDCPKANFANVYINGTLRGLYSNAESIDEKFVADHYYDNLGSFFKCNPVGGAGPGSSGSPDLKYLGTDSSLYATSYELESTYGWNDMVTLTNTINNNFTAIESQLDIDRAIWMLAFNNVLVNLDSYNGTFRQNYYLYKDLNDRFVPTVWDLNMSFGGFPGGGSSPTTLDPFSNSSSANHPLIVKILGNATYKKMYMAHIRTILNDIFASGDYLTTANTLRTTIDASVQADPYKFYTYTQFQNSLTTNVTGGGGGGGGGFTIYGIQNLMGARVTFFQSNTDFNYVAPTIVSHSFSNPTPNYGDNNTINVTCSNETEVYFGYRFAIEKNFTRVQLFDDGAHNDGAAGDHVYGTNIQMNGAYMQYFIYAQNGTAGIFSPERAEHEYHILQITVPTTVDNEVVINEIMAKNTDYVFDNYGQDDDWLELFNTTSLAKSLVGLYLTDDNTNLTKWSFPTNSFIAPNDYYIVWVDDDSTQSGVHANFKISSTAETIYLTNGVTIFDTVTSGVLASNEAWARCPDAGVFTIAVPTFDASNNCFLTISEAETKETFTVFPVPAVDNTTIRIENSDSYELSVVDMQGRIIYASDLSSGDNIIECSEWKSGVYQFVLKNEVSFETKVVSFMKQ